MPFFVIFFLIPFLEIMVFMSVGGTVGFWNTLLLALLTAMIGGFLVKKQGLETLEALRRTAQSGTIPLNEIFDGICLIIAGATLITPGFVTDTIGFLLLLPPIRAGIKHYIRTHTNWHTEAASYGQGPRSPYHNDPNVIEAEYERVDDERP